MKRRFKVNDHEPGYVKMTTFGDLFGVSSHVIGRWLREIGWRTSKNKPSQEAFDQDLARPVSSGRNNGYFFVWHEAKTIEALEKAGHRRVK